MSQLENVHKSLNSLTSFLQPALPFVNSHLTEFFTASYWENWLPKSLQDDLDSKSVEEIKECVLDLISGNWRSYPCSTKFSEEFDFTKTGYSFKDLIVQVGKLQLSEMKMSIPLDNMVQFNNVADSIDLKFDTIMSAKKTHEVEVMSSFITKVSQSVQFDYDFSSSGGADLAKKSKPIEYLVDVGSGKGYLSSFLTLLYEFKVLAIDSSSINTVGCEKRGAKLEKAWASLVRRAVERRRNGTCTKRGKFWKSKENNISVGLELAANKLSAKAVDQCQPQQEVDVLKQDDASVNENKLLKTLTQFVDPDFDLTESIQINFPLYSFNDQKPLFGLIGLHTCGNLGVDSLRLFIANEKAKFICNVPCCYHLIDENPWFYPTRRFEGSKMNSREINDDTVNIILNPGFPLSKSLDIEDRARFCLGRNARMMSAYSLHRMAHQKNGMDLHPSIFHRCLLQVLIKQSLGDAYCEMDNSQHNVGKIGDKCLNFEEYVRRGLVNMHLSDKVKPSEEEIEMVYHAFEKEKERLQKYYLVRAIFAPLVEGCILLDRLAFLLEQECVEEAFIVELFDPAVSPRSHAIFSYKR